MRELYLHLVDLGVQILAVSKQYIFSFYFIFFYKGGNSEVQKSVIQYFKNSPTSEILFYNLSVRFEHEIEELKKERNGNFPENLEVQKDYPFLV